MQYITVNKWKTTDETKRAEQVIKTAERIIKEHLQAGKKS